MKFKKINENKIMVTLSWKELASRDLDARALKNNSVEYQKLFWDMMAQARDELGFDVHGSQLMVETVPDKEGNIMMIITKSGNEVDLQGNLEKMFHELFQISNNLENTQEPSKKKLPTRYDTFRFDDFEALVGLAQSVGRSCTLVNKLYCFEDAYFLVVKSAAKMQEAAETLFDFAMEFNGVPLESVLWMPLLEERGKKIIKAKALQTLAEKFLN